MKSFIKNTFILSVLFFVAAPGFSQLKLPQLSSTQTIVQDLGLGKITLTYSRPNVKGRQIFGSLVPYNEVWRTGANTATIITFTDEVKVNGTAVPAGEYGLFSIPTKNEWTIMLSKKPKQWGSYTYDQADDQLRFTIKPEDLKNKAETFTIQFSDVSPKSAKLNLMWENTGASFTVTADADAKVMAGIDSAMQASKKPYMQAVQYYYENDKDLNKALGWATEAEAAQPKSFSVKLWKARVQLKMGDKKGAAVTAQQGVDLATEAKNKEYIRLNNMVLAEAK